MDTICINNVTLYPGIEPPKGIIYRYFRKDENGYNIKIWISKCKNIFYTCSKNHPLAIYQNQDVPILCHLFYILYDIVSTMITTTFEYNFIVSFLNASIEYFRFLSPNSYEESLVDPVVAKLFNEYFLPVNVVGSFTLSKLRSKIMKVKMENNELRKEVIGIFEKMDIDFVNIKNIMEDIKKFEKKNEATQTDVENVWKKKSLQKNVETQSEFIVKKI